MTDWEKKRQESIQRMIQECKDVEKNTIEEMKSNHNIRVQKSRDIIYGYIKDAQSLFLDEEQFIPPEIAQLCLIFYHEWKTLKTENVAINEKEFYQIYWIEHTRWGAVVPRFRKLTRKTDKKVFMLRMLKIKLHL